MMFELDTITNTNNRIVASAAKTAWQNDMEGWRRLIEEATSEELKSTYKTLLRPSQSYCEQHLEQTERCGKRTED
jgi:hypothetical protein